VVAGKATSSTGAANRGTPVEGRPPPWAAQDRPGIDGTLRRGLRRGPGRRGSKWTRRSPAEGGPRLSGSALAPWPCAPWTSHPGEAGRLPSGPSGRRPLHSPQSRAHGPAHRGPCGATAVGRRRRSGLPGRPQHPRCLSRAIGGLRPPAEGVSLDPKPACKGSALVWAAAKVPEGDCWDGPLAAMEDVGLF
jgi:hypothetical protein